MQELLEKMKKDLDALKKKSKSFKDFPDYPASTAWLLFEQFSTYIVVGKIKKGVTP